MLELKELEILLRKGKITRREFLARSTALGLTVALSPALLSTPVHASAPKKGGRLRIAVDGGQTTDSLDPATVNNFLENSITFQLRNCLIEIDHKGNLIPELAESWEPAPDAKKWIINLRKGVEFHNGKTMEVDDVIFSLNHHRGEKSKSGAKTIVNQIKSIKSDGKHAFIVTLENGNADFPSLLSQYSLQIVPKDTSNFDDGIGTGAYTLVNYKPGLRALTKKNPNYWKEGRAHFNEIESLGISDVVARTNALKSGQIDVMNQPDLKTIDLLAKEPNIQIVETPSTGHYSIPMLTDAAPYDNKDVRLGLKYALDRDQILKTVLRGHGALGNDHPISPSYKYYASELPQRKYDPDKAKYYLKKAGFAEHIFKLHVAPNAVFPGAQDTAILYREHALKAGINIKVVSEPDDGYWSEVYMKKPWFFSFSFGRPTEDWVFTVFFAADAAWNESKWKNERFNKLLIEARSELDEAKRREIYGEMQKIVHDDCGYIVPVFNNYVLAATTKLKFDGVASNYPLDGARLPERWWFES